MRSFLGMDGSGGESFIQLVEDSGKLIAKQLVGAAQSTPLTKRRIIEIVGRNTQAGGDVISDQPEPTQLVG